MCTLAPLSHLCPSLAVVCSVTKVAMISVRCFSLIREPAVLKAPLRACSIVRRRPGSSVFCRHVYRCNTIIIDNSRCIGQYRITRIFCGLRMSQITRTFNPNYCLLARIVYIYSRTSIIRTPWFQKQAG